MNSWNVSVFSWEGKRVKWVRYDVLTMNTIIWYQRISYCVQMVRHQSGTTWGSNLSITQLFHGEIRNIINNKYKLQLSHMKNINMCTYHWIYISIYVYISMNIFKSRPITNPFTPNVYVSRWKESVSKECSIYFSAIFFL